MKIDREYKFPVNISNEHYRDKNEARTCVSSADAAKKIGKRKMAFRNVYVTADNFLEYITSGYSFCNLFEYNPDKEYWIKNNNPKIKLDYVATYPEYKRGFNKGCMKIQFKSDDFFKGSYCVSIDIDDTKYGSMRDFVERLSVKPSIGYYTFSDSLEKRKFRLIYIFDEMLDEEMFYRISRALHSIIGRDTEEKVCDECGTKGSQYFNGTSWQNHYISYNIYSINDFADYIAEETDYSRCSQAVKVTPTVSPDLVSDMERLDYDEFMHSHSKRFRYWYRVEKNEWIEGKFQYVDDDYFSLYYNVSKLKDGMCRKKKLFQRMCLRRIISKNATPDEILFNAYVDLAKFIDNSEDPITIADLARNVNSCFKYTVEELEDKFKFVLKAARETTRPKNGKIYRNRMSVKDANQFEISMFYVPGLSIAENLEILHMNGVKVSQASLYAYARENGITTKKHSDEEIKALLSKEDTIAANQKRLQENGIKVSDTKVYKLMKSM